MSFSLTLSSLLITIFLFPGAFGSGYILLDITASTDCDIGISANLNLEHIRLRNGDRSSTVIRPATGARHLDVSISMYDFPVEKVSFDLVKTSQNPMRKLFSFGDVAILVEAVFECDRGFYGRRCEHQKLARRARTSTTTTVPPTSTEVVQKLAEEPIRTHTDLYIFIIPLTIVFLLIVIISITCFIRSSSSSHPDQNCQNADPEDVKTLDDTVTCPNSSQRYSGAPYTMVFISNI